MRPAPVDQDHVEVAVGAQLAAAVATHRDEGEPPVVASGHRFEQFVQPPVGHVGVEAAEGVAPQVGPVEQGLAVGAERHGGTVPPRPHRSTGPCPDDGRAPRPGRGGYRGGVAEQGERSGLSTFDLVLLVAGGLVVVWTLFKLVILIVAVAVVVRLVFGRKR
jgi:hypothetical protein